MAGDDELPGDDDGFSLTQVGGVIVLSAPSLTMPASLSRSEQAVARAVVAGRSNAEIAAGRGTSVKTVANQLSAIYCKLGVDNRDELVALVVGGAGPISADDRRRS